MPPPGTIALDAQPVDAAQLAGLQELRATALVHSPAMPPALSGAAMMGILEEMATDEWLGAVKRQSELYDKMCRALITDADEQVADEDRNKPPAQQRRFKKKSAWRKLAKAFRVSTEILSIRRWWETDADGTSHLCAEVVVRATAPWGQQMEAVAGCSTRETKFTSRGPAAAEWVRRRDAARQEEVQEREEAAAPTWYEIANFLCDAAWEGRWGVRGTNSREIATSIATVLEPWFAQRLASALRNPPPPVPPSLGEQPRRLDVEQGIVTAGEPVDAETIAALLDGRLSPEQRERLLRHLAQHDDDAEVTINAASVLREMEEEDADTSS